MLGQINVKPRANGRNIVGQQLPTFLLFHDHRSVAEQCWIRLHSSSNIVGAAHAHYAWFTKTSGLYPSHEALQGPILVRVVASVGTPLPTRTQQVPTLLAQQCWELLRPFARSLTCMFSCYSYPTYSNMPLQEGCFVYMIISHVYSTSCPSILQHKGITAYKEGWAVYTEYPLMSLDTGK